MFLSDRVWFQRSFQADFEQSRLTVDDALSACDESCLIVADDECRARLTCVLVVVAHPGPLLIWLFVVQVPAQS